MRRKNLSSDIQRASVYNAAYREVLAGRQIIDLKHEEMTRLFDDKEKTDTLLSKTLKKEARELKKNLKKKGLLKAMQGKEALQWTEKNVLALKKILNDLQNKILSGDFIKHGLDTIADNEEKQYRKRALATAVTNLLFAHLTMPLIADDSGKKMSEEANERRKNFGKFFSLVTEHADQEETECYRRLMHGLQEEMQKQISSPLNLAKNDDGIVIQQSNIFEKNLVMVTARDQVMQGRAGTFIRCFPNEEEGWENYLAALTDTLAGVLTSLKQSKATEMEEKVRAWYAEKLSVSLLQRVTIKAEALHTASNWQVAAVVGGARRVVSGQGRGRLHPDIITKGSASSDEENEEPIHSPSTEATKVGNGNHPHHYKQSQSEILRTLGKKTSFADDDKAESSSGNTITVSFRLHPSQPGSQPNVSPDKQASATVKKHKG